MKLDPDQLKLSPAEIRSFFDARQASPHHSLDVFDLAALAMGIVAPSGYWLRANPAMSTLFGYEPDKFLGLHSSELIHPDDLDETRRQFDALRDGQRDHASIEIRCVQSSGEIIWTRQHVTPLRPPALQATYFLLQVENISDLKASESLRLQQANLHETLVKHLPGMLVCVFDRDLRFTLVEGRLDEDHSLNQETLLGKTPREVLADPAYADFVEEHYLAVLEGEARTYELNRDGRSYQIRVVPVPDDSGAIDSGMAIFIDTTELKAVEASRRRRGEIYRAIVRNLPGAIAAVFDRDLRYLVVDGHGLTDLNLTPEMVEGKMIQDFWGADRCDNIVQKLKATIDGEPQIYDATIGTRHYEVRTVPIHEADGSIEIGVVVNFDITSRKEHERQVQLVSEALAKSNRELEEFASVAAHDLRAPLVTVHGLASILSEDYRDVLDHDGQHLIDRIVANATQMQTLLGELLDISRLGRSETDVAPVSLSAVIEHVCKHQKITLERRNVELLVAVEDVTLLANWTRIVQLFSNLVDNAIKYTPGDRTPRIEITATAEGDQWLISVSDNGIGIPEDHLETVFEMFKRLRTGQELNPQGSGMGLALVERIVNLHGGQIWIDPEVSAGATFRMLFPKPARSDEGVVA